MSDCPGCDKNVPSIRPAVGFRTDTEPQGLAPRHEVVVMPSGTIVTTGVQPKPFALAGFPGSTGVVAALSLSADEKKNQLEGCRAGAKKKVQEATEELAKCLAALSDDAKRPGKTGYDKCVKDYNDACDAADLALRLNEERYK